MTELGSKAASPMDAASVDAPQEARLVATHECAGCGEFYLRLPVIDSENGQGYCTDDCHEEASERYWTAAWSA